MPHYKRIQYEIFSAPQNRLYSILFYTLLATTEDIAHWRENPERCATSRLKAVGETRYFNTGKAQSTNLKAQITNFWTASFINKVSSSLQQSARRKALKVFAQLSSRKTRAVSKPNHDQAKLPPFALSETAVGLCVAIKLKALVATNFHLRPEEDQSIWSKRRQGFVALLIQAGNTRTFDFMSKPAEKLSLQWTAV